jgi:hypothetical protein
VLHFYRAHGAESARTHCKIPSSSTSCDVETGWLSKRRMAEKNMGGRLYVGPDCLCCEMRVAVNVDFFTSASLSTHEVAGGCVQRLNAENLAKTPSSLRISSHRTWNMYSATVTASTTNTRAVWTHLCEAVRPILTSINSLIEAVSFTDLAPCT